MKKAKALFSLALVVALAASLCVSAFAAEAPDDEETDSKTFIYSGYIFTSDPDYVPESAYAPLFTFDHDFTVLDDEGMAPTLMVPTLMVPVGTSVTTNTKGYTMRECYGSSTLTKLSSDETVVLDKAGIYALEADFPVLYIQVVQEFPEGSFEVTESSNTYKVKQYIDGKYVESEEQTVQTYTVTDEAGNQDTYIRIRDFAELLKDTDKKVSVNWTPGEKGGTVSITSGEDYVPNGTEFNAPFEGTQTAKSTNVTTEVNGKAVELQTFTITDANGGDHTFYHFSDLCEALGISASVTDGVFSIDIW